MLTLFDSSFSQNLLNRYHYSFSIFSFSYLSIIIIAGIIDISTKIVERKFPH